MTIISAAERTLKWDSMGGQFFDPPEITATPERVFAAALHLVNPLFSMREALDTLWNYVLPPSDYDPYPDIPDDMLPYADAYWKARNKADVERITGVIKQQLEDEEVLQSSGLMGVAFTLLAGATDPLQYMIPGSYLFRTVKNGKKISPILTAGRFAAGGAVSNIPSEIFLQLGLPEYTTEQSVYNTLAAGLLTGGLGYAAARMARFGEHVAEIADTLKEYAESLPESVDPEIHRYGLPPNVAVTPEIRELEGLPPIEPPKRKPGEIVYDWNTGKTQIINPEKIPEEEKPLRPGKKYVYRNGLMFQADADLIDGDYVIYSPRGVENPDTPVPAPPVTPKEADQIIEKLGGIKPEEVKQLIEAEPSMAPYAERLEGKEMSIPDRLRHAGLTILGDEDLSRFGDEVFNALRLEDETIAYSREIKFHGAFMDKLDDAGITAKQISEDGYIYRGQFYTKEEYQALKEYELAAAAIPLREEELQPLAKEMPEEKIEETTVKEKEIPAEIPEEQTIAAFPESPPKEPAGKGAVSQARIISTPEGYELITQYGTAYAYIGESGLTTKFKTLEEAQAAAKALGLELPQIS